MKVVKIDGLNNIIFIFYIYFLFQIFGLLFNKTLIFLLEITFNHSWNWNNKCFFYYEDL